MPLFRYYPIPGDRMGFLWCATQIKGLGILEFGPMGTTNFATRHMGEAAPIYSTHINNHILTFGDPKNLRSAVKELDASGKFQAIVVALSSSTSIIGFDMESFCMELQEEVSTKLIPLSYSSLGIDYTVGMEKSIKMLLQQFAKPLSPQKGCYNILGCCDDEYLLENDLTAIKAALARAFQINCRMTFPYKTSIEQIEGAAEAEFNLVLRPEALPAAKWMEQQFGTPYLLADCYGNLGMEALLSGAASIIGRTPQEFCTPSLEPLSLECRNQRVLILGSRGSAAALARTLHKEFGMENIQAMCFSREAGGETVPAYDERILERLMNEFQPQVLLGNSAVFDFPGRAPAIEIPVIKPVGIVGRTPKISQPLRTWEGLAALRKMLTGELNANPPTPMNPFR